MYTQQAFNVHVNGDKTTSTIAGMCQIDSGQLVIADFYNSKLKVLNCDYGVVSNCDVPNFPQGICNIGDNGIAVAVDGYRKRHELHFFHVKDGQLTCKNIVKVDHACLSLSFNPNSVCLYISDGRCIFVYSTGGEKLRCLYKDLAGKYSVRSMAVSGNGQKIYVVNLDIGKLVILDNQGRRLATVSDLDRPVSVCTSSNGHVFVACYGSRDVTQMDGNGNNRKAVLGPERLVKPWSLCFHEGNSNLIIGQDANNDIILIG